jgi:cytochrome c peroxidase
VNYAKALGAFERTIVTDNSPYLRYLGGDKSALSRQQKDGLLLFFGKANCDQCHGGPMFSDFGFHALGVADNPSHPDGTDAGKDDLYQFRTPTLHNATLTGPYMHNGMFATLRDVVNFKNAGVSENQNVGAGLLDPNFTPLNLTDEEIDDLVAFLRSLTDTDFDQTAPTTVPSGLEVGGNIH